MILQNLHDDFLRSLVYLKGCSPKTIRSYRQSFTSFQQSLAIPHGSPACADDLVNKAQLEAWVIWMRAKGMSAGGANVYIRGMNSFLSHLEEQEIQTLPRLKVLRTETNSLETFSDSDIRLILSFRPRTFYDFRLWTLIQCLIDTGCRIEEVLSIPENDVDMENCLLAVNGKGNKIRRVPFSLELRKALFRYAQIKSRQGISGYFFSTHDGSRLMYRNILRDVTKFCEGLGITGVRCSPHTFRHTFATNFIRNGGNPFHLQRILGHNHISTTMKYVHLQSEDLSKAHAQFGILSRLR